MTNRLLVPMSSTSFLDMPVCGDVKLSSLCLYRSQILWQTTSVGKEDGEYGYLGGIVNLGLLYAIFVRGRVGCSMRKNVRCPQLLERQFGRNDRTRVRGDSGELVQEITHGQNGSVGRFAIRTPGY